MNEFNSQVCTTIEQSKRLLAMGLKSETADMSYYSLNGEVVLTVGIAKVHQEIIKGGKIVDVKQAEITPAWTLHRLIKFLPHVYGEYWELHNSYLWYYNHHKDLAEEFNGDGLYDVIIECLEWLVNNGLFNQDTE